MQKFSQLCVVAALLTQTLSAAAWLPAQPSPPRARIVADLRLDAIKEDLPSVSSVSVGPRGRIAIVIPGDAQIRLYNANGSRIGAVGRKGDGPGEFRDIGSLTWKSDTLVVDDSRQRRVTFISPDAKVLRTALYPTIRSVQLAARKIDALNAQNQRLLGTTADGSQVAYWNEPVAKPTPIQQALGGPPYVLRIPPNGDARAIFDASAYTDDRIAMEAYGMGDFAPFTFVPKVVASTTGDRVAELKSFATSSEGGTFAVTAVRSSGDVVFARTFPFKGVPIPKAARDSEIADYANGGGEGGKAASLRFQEQARQKMPMVYAGVADIVLGLDNTVWITLRTTAEGRPVLVLNGKGDPIATVLLPANARLRQASATQLWVTERDKDGLTSVVRYKVAGVNCGVMPC